MSKRIKEWNEGVKNIFVVLFLTGFATGLFPQAGKADALADAYKLGKVAGYKEGFEAGKKSASPSGGGFGSGTVSTGYFLPKGGGTAAQKIVPLGFYYSAGLNPGADDQKWVSFNTGNKTPTIIDPKNGMSLAETKLEWKGAYGDFEEWKKTLENVQANLPKGANIFITPGVTLN